jgi:hypothetical protein
LKTPQTDQPSNFDSPTSNFRQEKPSLEKISNPALDFSAVSDRCHLTTASIKTEDNRLNLSQPNLESLLVGIGSMNLDFSEVPAIFSAVQSKTGLPPLDDENIKELNSLSFKFLLGCILSLQQSIVNLNMPVQKQKQSVLSRASEPPPLEIKKRDDATNYKNANILLSLIQHLQIFPNDSRGEQIKKWLKWRTSFFCQLKKVDLDQAFAATVLQSHLPEMVKAKISEKITNPIEMAQAVDEAILGDTDISVAAIEGLLDFLDHNKMSTPSGILRGLKHWRSADSSINDIDGIWCKFAMHLLPKSACRKICEWPEYINEDYKGLWDRLNNKVFTVVTNDEFSTFRRQKRSFISVDTTDEPIRRRRRQTKGLPQ